MPPDAINTSPQNVPPRPRRLWQISLRGLLLAMLVLAGLIAWKAQRVHRQRQIVRQIESLGGSVRFDYQLAASKGQMSRWRVWCGRYLGDDFFGQVQVVSLSGCRAQDVSFLSELPALTSVNLSGTQVSDFAPLRNLRQLTTLKALGAPVRDLSPLAGLTNLETLDLENTAASDLQPLAGLTKVKFLSLAGTQVSDVRPLTGMSQLTELKLFYAPVRQAQPLAQLQQLEYLDLCDTQVTDAAALSSLTRLGYLGLSRTPSPPEEVQALRQSLPKCLISFKR
jgi:Leucine-rich repeat (LRR) protein